MAWTYTANFAEPRDKVRLLLGDTLAAEPLCSDDEVAFALGEEGGNVYRAAAFLADRLAARFASDEAVSIPGVSLSGAAQRTKAFRELATNLRAEAARRGSAAAAASHGGGALVLAGVRASAMAEAEADADRIKPAFRREHPLVPDVEGVVL